MEEPRFTLRQQLLFGAITAAFVLICIEAMLQIYYYASAGDFLFRRVLPRIFVEDATRCYRVRDDLDYTHRTNEFSTRFNTNSLGMRSGSLRTTPSVAMPYGHYRVLFLGPSFTFGWGSEYEEIYPTLIAQGLRAPGLQVEALNLGTPAQGPGPQLCWLQEEGHRFEPDLIVQTSYGGRLLPVVGDCPQELGCPHVAGGRLYKESPSASRRVIAWAKNSALVFYGWYLYNLVAAAPASETTVGQELYSEAARIDSGDLDELAAQYRRYLGFVREVVGEETEVLFLHIPLSFVVHPSDASRWSHLNDANPESARARIGAEIQGLRERGIEVYDATDALRARSDQRLYYWLDIHFTPAGNRALAEAALPWIQAAVDQQLAGRRSRPGP